MNCYCIRVDQDDDNEEEEKEEEEEEEEEKVEKDEEKVQGTHEDDLQGRSSELRFSKIILQNFVPFF